MIDLKKGRNFMKKLFWAILIGALFIVTPVCAQEIQSGLVTTVCADYFGFEITICTSDHSLLSYTTASNFRIGNETDGYSSSIDSSVLNGILGEIVGYSLNSADEISAIHTDYTYTSYTGVAYDIATEAFVCGEDTVRLPSYMVTDNRYDFAPYLDDNCQYDIDVNDYGVLVNNCYSDVYDVLITNTNTSTEAIINQDFNSYNICVFVEDLTAGKTLHLTGLDGNGNILAERSCEIDEYFYAEADFDVLDKNVSYFIRLWVEDENGEIVSNIFNTFVPVTEIVTEQGYVEAAAFYTSDFDDPVIEIEFTENTGNTVYWTLSDKCLIKVGDYNGFYRIYRFAEDEGNALANALCGKQVKFVLDEDLKVCAIEELSSYSVTTPEETENGVSLTTSFTNVSFDAVVVYAQYDIDGFVKADVKSYAQCQTPYLVSNDIEHIEIFVWDGMNTMQPLTETEPLYLYV